MIDEIRAKIQMGNSNSRNMQLTKASYGGFR